ncbi:MAG: GWxTD domain-containing protein, partial [Rhodothermales bacterium]
FAMEVVARVDDDATGVDVHLAVPHASLVFLQTGGGYAAAYEMSGLVRDGAETVYRVEWIDTVHASTYRQTQTYDPLLMKRRIALDPGRYTIEMALEDAESGARTVRTQGVTVSDPHHMGAAVGDLLLEDARAGSPFQPVVSVHVPGSYDSLRIVTEVYNVSDTADVTMTLVSFETDSTVASPPFWFTPDPFSLAYKGVDYDAVDTVQASRRRIGDAEDRLSVEFSLPALDVGTYAVEVRVSSRSGTRTKYRHFTVKRPSFPRITSLTEMVHALSYIARDDELRRILAARSEEEMKRRFDAFWADRVPSREAAAALLSTYYSRVEEANIRFSGYKSGWKTDRGMIYILFGPPAYEEETASGMAWYYFEPGAILNRRLPPFVFRRSRAYGNAGLFDTYVLQRREAYEDDWRRRVEDWRDGTAV